MNFGQDIGLMSEAARRDFDQRDRHGISTHWTDASSTTPSHCPSTPKSMKPMGQAQFSSSAASYTIAFSPPYSPAYPLSPGNMSPSPSRTHPQLA
jgi:hypothetical protein